TAEAKDQPTVSNLLSVSVTCHACGEKGHYKSQCSSKTENDTSHVSKKSLCDESLIIPKKEIWLDDKLNYMEAFIGGLPQSIEGNVTASKPQTLEEATNIANKA
ncbi:putative reverse transcriptase domain-containing protein, partial [Tanacetum coccineum]